MQPPVLRPRAAARLAAVLGLGLLAACEVPVGGSRLPVQVLWRTSFPNDLSGTDLPVVEGDRLFFVDKGVVALDTNTGRVLWRSSPPGYSYGKVAVRDGRVFTVGDVAMALDARTGRELWRFQPEGDGALAWPAADAGAFYFVTRSHRVYALEAATGRKLWEVDVGPDWRYEGIGRGVSVSGDTVYAAGGRAYSVNGYYSAGWIAALDRSTGRELWRYWNGDGTDSRNLAGPPTVAGRYLLAADALGSAFVAVDRFTGKQTWRRELKPGYAGNWQSPVVAGGTAYWAGIDATILAVDVASGHVRWRTEMTPGSFTNQAVCGDRLFANRIGLVVLDRADGNVVGTMLDSGDDRATSGFAVSETGDRVFVASFRAVYALRCR